MADRTTKSITYCSGGGCKTQLTDLTLSYDDKMKRYYLSACYRFENDSEVKDIYIPKALLPINTDRVAFLFDSDSQFPSCDIGFGELNLCRNSEYRYMWEQIVEEKTHEMTLDEIEKKLGYKVKIVNSK